MCERILRTCELWRNSGEDLEAVWKCLRRCINWYFCELLRMIFCLGCCIVININVLTEKIIDKLYIILINSEVSQKHSQKKPFPCNFSVIIYSILLKLFNIINNIIDAARNPQLAFICDICDPNSHRKWQMHVWYEIVWFNASSHLIWPLSLEKPDCLQGLHWARSARLLLSHQWSTYYW